MPDFVNGMFEFVGAMLMWLSVRQLARDRMVRGVHALPVAFFAAWSIWNLFYYPHLWQWWSFAGGVFMALANVTWSVQMIYWALRERRRARRRQVAPARGDR